VRTYPTATVDDVCHPSLAGRPLQGLDVRQRSECREAHVPGSVKLFVGNLPQQRRDVPKRTLGLVYRASLPGSLSVYPPRTRSTRHASHVGR
jgi:hypothetical protein